MSRIKRWPIGLQSSTTGDPRGIGEVINELTKQNIAFFSASTDSFSILTDLEIARENNPEVPHTGNFTLTGYASNNYHLNVPRYGKPATEELGSQHWDKVEEKLPINDPQRSPIKWHIPCIWMSTWNEVRSYVGWSQRGSGSEPEQPVPGYEGNADLIGQQAYYIGKEAVRRGYRWAAFGFAGGNPEEGFWDAPGVRAYLKLCEEFPEQLGVALHEYALADTLRNNRNIGRFEQLHDACDRHGIRRPVIQFKEFGWRDTSIPNSQRVALEELLMAANIYMKHPNIHGAAIWTVQEWQGSNINIKVRELIPHLRNLALQHAKEIPDMQTA